MTLTKRVQQNTEGDFDDLIYTCNKCNTVFKQVAMQYSINFEFVFFKIVEPNFTADIGREVEIPIPLLQGLFGFEEQEIEKCAKDFRLGNAEEVFEYLTARA